MRLKKEKRQALGMPHPKKCPEGSRQDVKRGKLSVKCRGGGNCEIKGGGVKMFSSQRGGKQLFRGPYHMVKVGKGVWRQNKTLG